MSKNFSSFDNLTALFTSIGNKFKNYMSMKKNSNTYAANASSCSVALDLDDGDYELDIICPEETVGVKSVTYASKQVNVVFKSAHKPTTAGTLWVVARKVV